MEGRLSPGAATVLGGGVASHACAACAYQTKAHPCRDNGGGSQCGGVSPNVLPAMDPVWENAIRDCAPFRREIGYLPKAGEVESETSRTTPDPTRKLGKGH